MGAPLVSGYVSAVSAYAGEQMGSIVAGGIEPASIDEGALGTPSVVGPTNPNSAYAGSAFGVPRLTAELVDSSLPKGYVR